MLGLSAATDAAALSCGWFYSQQWTERSLCYTCVNDVNTQITRNMRAVISLHSFISNIEWWLFSVRNNLVWWIRIVTKWAIGNTKPKKKLLNSFPLSNRCLCHLFVAYCWYRNNDKHKKTRHTVLKLKASVGGVATMAETHICHFFSYLQWIDWPTLRHVFQNVAVLECQISPLTNQRHNCNEFLSNRQKTTTIILGDFKWQVFIVQTQRICNELFF